MDNLQNAVEIIKSLIFVIEGSDDTYGLIDRQDAYYINSHDMIDIDKLLKEAKSFLAGVK